MEKLRGKKKLWYGLILAVFIFWGCTNSVQTNDVTTSIEKETITQRETHVQKESTTKNEQTAEITDNSITLADIPEYTDTAYVAINDNQPFFAEEDLKTDSYEYYSELDALGRCGVVQACIGEDIMPTEERGEIGAVKPSGWHTVKYNGIVEGNYLYNRCHLIGYQLTGENANKKNLITGTRSMNVDGMLPFENLVADYVEETENHVMYRVTPMYDGDNLVAQGVLMEAKSVEDDGDGILFNVFVYNVQEGIIIDYADGTSTVDETASSEMSTTIETPTATEEPTTHNSEDTIYVWISETGSKYHSINDCGNMNPDKAYQMSLSEALQQGYGECSKCH